MVVIKTYNEELHYPKGKRVSFPKKDPWLLKVMDKDGKVIAVHKDWKYVSVDNEPAYVTAGDAYISALMRQSSVQAAIE